MARRTLESEGLARHLDRLYRAALGLTGDRQDAEDLVQETCLHVLRRPRVLRGGAELPYLLATLRNVWRNELRTRSRRPAAVAPLDEERDAAPGGLGPQARAEAAAALAAVAALPEPLREALVLVDVCGLSYAEAGRAVGAPEATVATRLFRARERVAQALG